MDWAAVYLNFYTCITEAKKAELESEWYVKVGYQYLFLNLPLIFYSPSCLFFVFLHFLGFGQNLAQLVASREQYLHAQHPDKKRKFAEMAGDIACVPSSGIVTTAKEWYVFSSFGHASSQGGVSFQSPAYQTFQN